MQLSPPLGKHEILVLLLEWAGDSDRVGWSNLAQKLPNIFPRNSGVVPWFFENFTGIFPIVAGKESIQHFGKGTC